MKTALLILGLLAATPALAQDNKEYLDMYQGYAGDTQTEIQKAHRSVREMEEWVSDTVANALLFQTGKVNTKLAAMKPLFSETGYKAYLNFLATQPFSANLRAQTLSLSTIVNNTPLLIGQGASGGRYAWAFELPVIMTPSGGTPSEPVILRIQIGRAANAPAPDGVVIENWQVYNEPVQNPPANP